MGGHSKFSHRPHGSSQPVPESATGATEGSPSYTTYNVRVLYRSIPHVHERENVSCSNFPVPQSRMFQFDSALFAVLNKSDSPKLK